jgi:hypothetical protein
MSRTTYIQIPPGSEAAYFKNLQSGSRFIFPRIRTKNGLPTRKLVNRLKRQELLSQIGLLWRAFDSTQKDAWNAAAAACGMVGYYLFVQDQSYRIKYGIPDTATPSLLHQYKVGRVVIEAPDSQFRITQIHPQSYFIYKKVTGTKSQYNPVPVTEDFALPLDISISYKSDLTAVGGNPYAKFYAIVFRNYQGRTLPSACVCDLDLTGDWATVSNTITDVVGMAVGYALYIEINDCTGELQFDNVRAEHNGQNWVRDASCNSVDVSFTKQYAQVPRNWTPEILENNSFFDSVYPT